MGRHLYANVKGAFVMIADGRIYVGLKGATACTEALHARAYNMPVHMNDAGEKFFLKDQNVCMISEARTVRIFQEKFHQKAGIPIIKQECQESIIIRHERVFFGNASTGSLPHFGKENRRCPARITIKRD